MLAAFHRSFILSLVYNCMRSVSCFIKNDSDDDYDVTKHSFDGGDVLRTNSHGAVVDITHYLRVQ